MEYQKKIKDEYNLHLIKTNKFKTLVFKIIFRSEITKEDIAMRNLLVDNLIFSNSENKTKKEMTIKKQDLYGAEILGSNTRISNQLVTELSLSILNPKYTEEVMLDESLKFFANTIFSPNVDRFGFNKENFNIIKEENLDLLKKEKENSTRISLNNLKKLVDKKSPIAYNMNGDKKIIDSITRTSLYKYYKNKFFKSFIDIYVIGDFDESRIEEQINKYFKFNYKTKNALPMYFKYPNKRKKVKEVIDNSNFNQSKLAISGYFKDISEYEKKYVSTLYTIILGSSPESKLFLNVREKNSYAYSINANYFKTDDFFLITAGISSKNYENVIKLIKEEIKNMQDGKILDSEVMNAKELIISVLKDIFEYPSSIIDYYFNMELLDHDDLETQIEIFKKITKEEIITLAKKMNLDIIYLLKERTLKDEKTTN